MNYPINAGEERWKRPRIVEIIGPAGAGKTTLFDEFKSYPNQFLLHKIPNISRTIYTSFFIRYGLSILPDLIRLYLYQHTGRLLSSREFAWMTILKGWPFILEKEVRNGPQVIVLDQGPVYLFAEMRETGSEYLRSKKAEKLWEDLYCHWAGTLDLIVWLDAEDSVLMERIQTREKEHIVKHEPTKMVFNFLDSYRQTYDYVVSRLGSCTAGPRILRIDTGLHRTEDIVNRLFTEFGIL